jgi:hypothetical protein
MIMRSRFVMAVGLLALVGCDSSSAPSLGGVGSCRPAATVTPPTGTIHVADTLRFAASVDGGCSAPVVRNDTPNLIRVDDVSPGVLRVTGLAVGTGRVRVLSSLDTTVSAAAAITVTP